jgi:hypothetical protein
LGFKEENIGQYEDVKYLVNVVEKLDQDFIMKFSKQYSLIEVKAKLTELRIL